ncbi:MAG: hypothetical protein H7X86_06990 [Gorillibacterium sp.]|nr:hypothetical protein [Gorillibacterium sp.]
MKLQGKNAFALILIGCGALILLGKLGPLLGWIMGLLIPIALLVFGYMGIKNGKKFIGSVLMVLGALLLFGKMLPLITLIVAVLLIGYGISMFRKKRIY